MSPALQRSLARPVERVGVGLHSGQPVRATVRPAPDGTGVQLVRRDVPGATPVPWVEDRVQDTYLATSVGRDGWRIATAEHLVAALVGLGVDNALIEVDGPEVPVLDGSAGPWVAAIREAGLRVGQARRRSLGVTKPVEVRSGPAWARLEPAAALSLEVSVAFDHPAVGAQSLAIRPTPDRFEAELCWARTFGFLEDVERLRAAGRARGGSLDNAVVFGAEGALNPGGLRAPDEVVRHKTLDLVGDLALFGQPLRAHLRVHRPGHGLTRMLVRAARAHLVALEAEA